MKRFCDKKRQTGLRRSIVSFAVFLMAALLLLAGVERASEKTKSERQKRLKEAVWRSVIQYYALEGRYPESLEVLKEEYGLQYEGKDFFVGYQVFGANLTPDITVIERED